MTCPKCKAKLTPWPWQDGGYKGVECPACGEKWWSDAFAACAARAENAAVAAVIETSPFPADAITDAQWRAERDAEEPTP